MAEAVSDTVYPNTANRAFRIHLIIWLFHCWTHRRARLGQIKQEILSILLCTGCQPPIGVPESLHSNTVERTWICAVCHLNMYLEPRR